MEIEIEWEWFDKYWIDSRKTNQFHLWLLSCFRLWRVFVVITFSRKSFSAFVDRFGFCFCRDIVVCKWAILHSPAPYPSQPICLRLRFFADVAHIGVCISPPCPLQKCVENTPRSNSKVGPAEANDSMVIYPSSTSPRFAYAACVARFAVASPFCQFARRCLCYSYKLLSLLVFWNQFVYAVDSGGALTSCKSHANQRSTFVCRAIVVAFQYCSSAFALEL